MTKSLRLSYNNPFKKEKKPAAEMLNERGKSMRHPNKGQIKGRSKIRKRILWSLLGLFLVVFGVVGYYAYSLYSFADKIHADPEDSIFKDVRTLTQTGTGTDLTPPKWEGKERVNILLLGGDSRGLSENEVPRSDSVMIASLDPVTKKSYLFSILRDTYVSIPGNGMDRINSAITKGGPELAMKTVSNLMGIPIQYYVYTDFKGFIALVDAVGGIDLDVEKDMKYSDAADGHKYDINLKKGYQHLDGNTALQYVRFRHDATSDFTRTERQRKFLKALAEKLQSTTSLLKLPSILQSVDPFIETNLNVNQMIKLASLGFEVKTDGMVSQQIPPTELLEEKRVGGAEVLGVDPDSLKVFVKQLFGEAPTAPIKKPSSGAKLSQGTDKDSGSAGAGSPSASGTKATAKPSVKPSATPKPAAVSPAASLKPGATPKPGKASPASGATATPAGAGQSGQPDDSAGGDDSLITEEPVEDGSAGTPIDQPENTAGQADANGKNNVGSPGFVPDDKSTGEAPPADSPAQDAPPPTE